jgi:hypothetical protein
MLRAVLMLPWPMSKGQLQVGQPVKDLAEILELVAVVGAILQRHLHTLRCAVFEQNRERLAVEFVAGVLLQKIGPTDEVRRAERRTHGSRHIQRAPQLVQRGLAHQRRGVVQRQVGRGVGDDRQPRILDGAAHRRPIGARRRRGRLFDGQVDKVKTAAAMRVISANTSRRGWFIAPIFTVPSFHHAVGAVCNRTCRHLP